MLICQTRFKFNKTQLMQKTFCEQLFVKMNFYYPSKLPNGCNKAIQVFKFN